MDEKKEVPAGDDKDENHRKTELAMACIAAIKPAWTSEEASEALAKAFLAEHPDIYEHIHVPADCLTDVVDKGEVQKVMEWEQEKQKEQMKKQFVLQTREQKMHEYFKIAKSWKCGGKPVKKAPYWLPDKNEITSAAVTQWIQKHAPPSVAITCDDYNGRWRIVSSILTAKSVSWTKRGFQKPAFEALHVAWTFEHDCSGMKIPYNMDELASKFADDGVG